MSKNILITGSSTGIGAEIAYCLSQNGHKVFLSGRNEDRLKQQTLKCNAAGYFVGDLSTKGYSEQLYSSAKETLGSVDAVVNNAGAYVWAPIEKTAPASIAEMLYLNLQVPYELCKLAVPEMKTQKWGRIVNIGSISGIVGEANASLYSTSKAGLSGMTKALALELAEHNITVNLVNPGWVKTDLTDTALENGVIDEDEQLDMIPQRRWIHPSEVASLVKYLISDDARGITGQSINLCAGLSLG